VDPGNVLGTDDYQKIAERYNQHCEPAAYIAGCAREYLPTNPNFYLQTYLNFLPIYNEVLAKCETGGILIDGVNGYRPVDYNRRLMEPAALYEVGQITRIQRMLDALEVAHDNILSNLGYIDSDEEDDQSDAGGSIWTAPPDHLQTIFDQLATRTPPDDSSPLLSAPPDLRRDWVDYWSGARSTPPAQPLTVRRARGSKKILGWLLRQLDLHRNNAAATHAAVVYQQTFECWANKEPESVRTQYLTGAKAATPPARLRLELTADGTGVRWIGPAKK
jgi:hypothetical protein